MCNFWTTGISKLFLLFDSSTAIEVDEAMIFSSGLSTPDSVSLLFSVARASKKFQDRLHYSNHVFQHGSVNC